MVSSSKRQEHVVRIEDYYDGFAIIVDDGKRFNFNDEEDRSKLLDVFRCLGIETTYEEVY